MSDTAPEPFGTDEASDAVRSLWLGVAEKAVEAAVGTLDPLATLRWALIAEAAYWQAAGDGDCFSSKQLAEELANAGRPA